MTHVAGRPCITVTARTGDEKKQHPSPARAPVGESSPPDGPMRPMRRRCWHSLAEREFTETMRLHMKLTLDLRPDRAVQIV